VHRFASVANNRLLLTVLLASLLLVLRDMRVRRPEPSRPDRTGWVRLTIEGSGARLVPFRRGEELGQLVRARLSDQAALLSESCTRTVLEPCTEVRIGRGENGKELDCQVVSLAEKCRYLHGLPMDINRADKAELGLLPGVGDKLADRILRERERGGGFSSVEGLRSVSGVGARVLQRLRERVTAGR